MSGASWPAAAWKPREAKEGAACRESVSWADGAKRVRRCFLTQKSGLPLPSDHSLIVTLPALEQLAGGRLGVIFK